MRASRGGGQIQTVKERRIAPSDILLHPGYRIEIVASELTFPTSLTFDDEGKTYVIEAGYCYGEVWTEPKLIRIGDDGSKTAIATGDDNGPWTALTHYNGDFFIAEGGELHGGRILRISPAGQVEALVDGLPSVGDHHTNGLVIKDNNIYFGIGTATNSAVVGEDNAEFGWLNKKIFMTFLVAT
jgi:hypothetical protein